MRRWLAITAVILAVGVTGALILATGVGDRINGTGDASADVEESKQDAELLAGAIAELERTLVQRAEERREASKKNAGDLCRLIQQLRPSDAPNCTPSPSPTPRTSQSEARLTAALNNIDSICARSGAREGVDAVDLACETIGSSIRRSSALEDRQIFFDGLAEATALLSELRR
jgi:hypothetical protein